MSRSTLAAAKAELVALLAPGGTPAVSTVTSVFDHLPPVSAMRGPVTVCVFTSGISANFWSLAVGVFLTSDVDHKTAQDDLDVLLPALDALMTAGFGPSTWDITYPTLDQPYFLATGTFEVGRQDYY